MADGDSREEKPKKTAQLPVRIDIPTGGVWRGPQFMTGLCAIVAGTFKNVVGFECRASGGRLTCTVECLTSEGYGFEEMTTHKNMVCLALASLGVLKTKTKPEVECLPPSSKVNPEDSDSHSHEEPTETPPAIEP